jgi:hypothetical protein
LRLAYARRWAQSGHGCLGGTGGVEAGQVTQKRGKRRGSGVGGAESNQNACLSAESRRGRNFLAAWRALKSAGGNRFRVGIKGDCTAQHRPRVRADLQSFAARHCPSSAGAAALAPPGRHPCCSSCSTLAHSPPGLRPSSFVPCFALLLRVRKAELVIVR